MGAPLARTAPVSLPPPGSQKKVALVPFGSLQDFRRAPNPLARKSDPQAKKMVIGTLMLNFIFGVVVGIGLGITGLVALWVITVLAVQRTHPEYRRRERYGPSVFDRVGPG